MTQTTDERNFDFEIIENDEHLKTLTNKLGDVHTVALDTEAGGAKALKEKPSRNMNSWLRMIGSLTRNLLLIQEILPDSTLVN